MSSGKETTLVVNVSLENKKFRHVEIGTTIPRLHHFGLQADDCLNAPPNIPARLTPRALLDFS